MHYFVLFCIICYIVLFMRKTGIHGGAKAVSFFSIAGNILNFTFYLI